MGSLWVPRPPAPPPAGTAAGHPASLPRAGAEPLALRGLVYSRILRPRPGFPSHSVSERGQPRGRCMATKLGCSPTREWLEWCCWGWVRAGQRGAEEAREPGGELASFPGKGSSEETQKPGDTQTQRQRQRQTDTGGQRGGRGKTKRGPESWAQPGRMEMARAADMCVVRLKFKREGRGG